MIDGLVVSGMKTPLEETGEHGTRRQKGGVVRAKTPVRAYKELIASQEDWLVRRVLQYAKRYGYTRYSSTLLEAWRQSVVGLSAVLIQAAGDAVNHSGLNADADYTSDPVTAYGIEEARKHRSRGVALHQFLSLLKYYRQSYLDLIFKKFYKNSNFKLYYNFTIMVFDKIELGCSAEWTNSNFFSEIFDLQQRNKAVTEQKLIYLTIFESLKDPVIFADTNGHIRNMNRSACLYFTHYDTPGAIYYGQKEIDEVQQLFEPFLDIVANEADFPNCLLPTRTGQRRFHIKARRMIDTSERMAGVVLICTDITDYQQALHDAARADRAKSAFLATMSHELRTPAAGILGASDLLGHTGLTPGQRRYLDLIDASASTLLGVLNEVLDYSKFEEAGVVASMADFDLCTVIDEVVKIMRYQALRKGVVLNVGLPASIPRRLRGDADKVRHVLMNLIGNAVKFTEHGEIDLTVRRIRKQQSAPITLEFSIVDTGIGISPDLDGRLFEPFSQGDETISRRFGGTGLGLAICKRIVDALGGEIGARRREKSGSQFWFRLPFGAAKTGNPVRQVQAEMPVKPRSVLMVEDNEVNQIVGVGLLEHLGHNVRLAGDGQDALTMMREADFDVVLLDLHLPGMDGYSIARAIRMLDDPHKARTPLIALTADGNAKAKTESFAAGMDGFLMKPLRAEELNRILGNLGDCANFPQSGTLSTASGSSRKLLEPGILNDHVLELGEDMAAMIVAAFRTSAGEFEMEFRQALQAGDIARIVFNVHRLKGAAGNVGLVELTRLSNDLERDVPKMPADVLEKRADQLVHCLRESLTAIDQHCQGLKLA